MPRFALIRTDTVEDFGLRREFESQPAPLPHKQPPLAWVPIVKATPPAYDPATEKLEGLPDEVTPFQVNTGRYQVAALTAEEIAENQAAEEIANERNLARQAYDLLRAGNASNAQVQRILARLVRDEYGE